MPDSNDKEVELKEAGGRTRLYLDADFGEDATIPLEGGPAHYLRHVLRAGVGDRLFVFNGRQGEWLAEIETVGKRGVSIACLTQTRPQADGSDLWLLFAPVKKTPSDYLVQKATELGVSRLQPVFTRRTIVTRVNEERLAANAIEAAEQSGRLTVPDIAEALPLEKALMAWPKDRTLYFCDEGGDARPLADVLAPSTLRTPASALRARGRAAAILTGPEGGFDPAEREMLRALSFVVPVTLGPRILRADTAALAALAVWQSVAGDWR